MFGICAFRFTVTSLSFHESSAILIDLSFFTVITAGLTKQSMVISVALSRFPFFINRFSPFVTCACRCIGIGRPFCCSICAPSFRYNFTERSLIFLLV